MGKSISKAFKKVVGSALNTVGLGGQAPVPQSAPEVSAAPTEVPQETVTDVDTEPTEMDAKKGKRVGKKALSVSRTSGGGISI